MGHRFPPLKTNSLGKEVRVRRQRRRAPAQLTKGSHDAAPPKPHPKGGKGWPTWLADTWHGYVGYKSTVRRRRIRATMKKLERRQARRRLNRGDE